MIKTYKWYHSEGGEEFQTDSNSIETAYDKAKDETTLYLGESSVVIGVIKGKVVKNAAKVAGKKLGWKVKVNTLPLKKKA